MREEGEASGEKARVLTAVATIFDPLIEDFDLIAVLRAEVDIALSAIED